MLGQLVKMLAAEGRDGTVLASLPLPALKWMTVTSRYPLDDSLPSELFEARDSDQGLTTAAAQQAVIARGAPAGLGALALSPVEPAPGFRSGRCRSGRPPASR